MKVFVSGGTGFVGGHLVEALLERGHAVRLLVHRQKEGGRQGVEQVPGDVTAAETLTEAVSGCDAVINLVGIIREFPSKGVTFRRLHVEATRNMLAAAERAGAKRYLQMSALGTRPGASSAYHRTKYEAEQLVRGSNLSYTIFRPSVIFGPGDSFVSLLAGYVRQYPMVPVIGNGEYRIQPVHVDDVARCFAQALQMSETVGKEYEICGPTRLSYNELLDTIGRVLGKKNILKAHAPLSLMRMVVPFLQRFPFFPITSDQISMLVEENICDGAWRQTFVFQPIPFEEGIATYLGK